MYAKLGNIFTPASASSDNFAYLYPNTKIFMKKSPITTLCAAGALVLSACSPSAEQNSLPAPHLEKRGNVTQLIVEGKPYLALACELGNSSSSSLEYMEPYWPQLKEAGVNTVLAVVSWEQVEPAEGSFDFSVLDGLISEARAHDLKLSILWFGSWKNGMSSYHPIWVKENPDKFPLAQTRDGDRLPILSTLGTATRDADAKAFAAMMKHIREVDAQEQTVVMIQVENEVGLHGYTRDYCPEANAAIAGQVPSQLMEYLQANRESLLPETLEAWKNGGFRTAGTWEEVFGKGDRTDEIFMAWNYASYMNAVAAAGKAEYDIPMFVNAWIVQPEDTRPGNYPSGGPQAQNHDVWRAAAPDIDILCPDIYLPEFPDILRLYSRAGNPVFIPESRAGQNGAANAAFAIGEMGAIGYSPFGFENGALSEANRTFNSFYRKAGAAADIILEAQASGNIRAAWVKGSDPAVYKQTLELGDYKIGVELVSSGMRNGGAPQLTGGTYSPDASGYAIAIRESDDSFLFLGSNVRITFLPADGQGTIGLAKVTEGDFRNGEWVEGRWLNGDQIQLRYDVLYAVDEGYSGQGLNFGTPEPGFIKVQLYKY